MRKPNSECSFSGCFEEVHAKGLCPGHHAQDYRVGKLAPLRQKTTPTDRFNREFKRGDMRDCWDWEGRLESGRGRFWGRGRLELAHVFSFEQAFGEVQEGWEVDHKCRRPSCVNPSHLRQVTRSQNASNKGLMRRNSSGYKGVHFVEKIGKYAARVTVEGKRVIVGNYTTPREAGEAALKARTERVGVYNLYDLELSRELGLPYPEIHEWGNGK